MESIITLFICFISLMKGTVAGHFCLIITKVSFLLKLYKENGACWHPVMNEGAFAEDKKKRKLFKWQLYSFLIVLHIITVNPSQLFSSGTFVAKGKLKKSNCVDAPLGASRKVAIGPGRLQPETPQCNWGEKQTGWWPRVKAPGCGFRTCTCI